MKNKYLHQLFATISNSALRIALVAVCFITSSTIKSQTPTEDKWSKLFYTSAGFDGDNIRQIKIFNDEVYICGDWGGIDGNSTYNYLMKWDGSKWDPIGKDLNGDVYDMIITSDSIIACGEFENVGGDATVDQLAIYHFDTKQWSKLVDHDNDGDGDFTFSGMMGGEAVHTIYRNGKELYVGGNFSSITGVSNTKGIAVLDLESKTWSALNETVEPTGPISDIEMIGDSLYLAGRFWKIGDIEFKGFASYSPTSKTWHQAAITSHWNFNINDLETDGTKLYLGGEFPDINGNTDIKYLASYDPATHTFEAVGPVGKIENGDGGVSDIFLADDALYAAGWVTFGSGSNKYQAFGKLKDGTWQNVSPVFDKYEEIGGSSIAVKSDGKLYTASSFNNEAGEENFRYFGEYDGTKWTIMHDTSGLGFNNNVNAVFVKDDVLYVGGDFTNAVGNFDADYFVYWNGTTWAPMGTTLNDKVSNIISVGDDLYIAGEFTNAGGDPNADHIAHWNGTDWESLGGVSFENATIYDLDTLGTSLYVAGNFTNAAGIECADHMAIWNGSNWSEVGCITVNNTIKAIDVVAADKIYIGGDFTDAGGNGNNDCLALWDGTTFQNLGTHYWGAKGVSDLQVKGDTIVIAGKLQNLNGNLDIDYIAMYNGTEWLAADTDNFHSYGTAVFIDGNDIYFEANGLYVWNANGVTELGGGLENKSLSPGVAENYDIFKHKSKLWVGGSFIKNKNGVAMGHISYYNLADMAVSGTPTSFTGTYGDNYTSQNVSFTASGLGEDVTVYAPENFEVSSDNTTFSSSYTVAQKTAEAGSNAVYFRPTSKLGAGSHSVNVKIKSDSTTVTVPLEATISKANLTATADNQSRVYGAANPTFTFSYTGFLNGDNEATLTTKPTATSSADALTNVGTATITVGGGVASNYNIDYVNGTLTIDKAELTVTADDKSKTYGDENPTFTYKISGFANNEDENTLTTKPTITSSATTSTGVGTVTITPSGAAANNYEFKYENGTLTINKAELTITADDKSKAYGDTNPTFTYKINGFVNNEDENALTTKPTVTSSATTSTGAGTVAIKPSGAAASNYEFKYENGTLTINKVELTVTVDDKSKTYGDANPTFTYNIGGFVNNEDKTVLTTQPSVTSASDASTGVGTATITASGAEADNYTFKYEDGTLTIDKAELKVTADDKSKTYGDANPEFTVSYNGFVNNEDETVLTTKPVAVSTADATTNVGTATITVSGGVADNYSIQYTDGTLTINKAKLTVTADNKSKYYGEENPTFTFSYDGFVNNDNETILSSNPIATVNANATTGAGTVEIIASGATANNYDISHVNGTLTINKVKLTVTADDKSKTYGDANPEFTFSYSGFVNGEDETVLTTKPTATADATSAVGTTTIIVSGGQADNYEFCYVNGAMTITKAKLLVKADDKLKAYGQENPAFTISYSGFVNGEDETVLTAMPTITSNANATTEVGTVTIAVSGATAENYEIEHENGTLTINKAELIVTADNKSKTYGEENPEFTISYSGFVNGEDETVLTTKPTATTDATSNAGTTDISVSGGQANNYEFNYENGTLTINKATLTVTADNQTKAYGSENPTFTLSYDGFVNGEGETALTTKPTAAADATSAVGTTTITLSGGQADNYEFSYINGTMTITKATLLVKADDKSKVYGEENPALTISYSGFVNGDDETVLTAMPTITSDADATTEVGTVTIAVSGATAENYEIEHENGTLTISKAKLTVTADDKSKVYGEENPTLTISYSGFANGEDETVLTTVPTITSDADATTGAGAITIAVNGATAENYEIEHKNGTLTISKAKLTVTADDKSKTYGEENPEFTVSYNGFVNNEDETVLSAKPTASSSTDATTGAGSAIIFVNGGSADNYDIAYVNGTLTINKAKLAITADNQQMKTGNEVPELTLTCEGFVNNDDENAIDVLPNVSTTATSESEIGEYPITLTGGEDDNYELILNNGILVISPTTGIEANIVQQITVYPNPASDFINVKTNSRLMVKIFDANGKLCKTSYSNESINIQNLYKGVYYIKVKDTPTNYKIVKY